MNLDHKDRGLGLLHAALEVWAESEDLHAGVERVKFGIRCGENPLALDNVCETLFQLGSEALKVGRSHEGESALRMALMGFIVAERNPLDIASTLGNLGIISYSRGNLEEAQRYQMEALEIDRRLAPGSLALAATLGNLGIISHSRGNLEEAQRYEMEALEINRRLAPGSLALAATLGDLGIISYSRGNLEEAQRYQMEALEINRRLAPGSLALAATLGNLGIISDSRGNLEEAQRYQMEALEINRRLAPGSLALAATLGNLGIISDSRGNLEEAQRYQMEALEIKRRLAPGSLALATTLGNLGNISYSRGNLEEAQRYQMEALEIKRRLAPGSLALATTLGNLGNISYSRGNLEEAQRYQMEALEIKRRLAPGSDDHVRILANLLEARTNDPELAQEAFGAYQALVGSQLLSNRLHFASSQYRVPVAYACLLFERNQIEKAFRVMEETKGLLLLAGIDLALDKNPAVRELVERVRNEEVKLRVLESIPIPTAEQALQMDELKRTVYHLNQQIASTCNRTKLSCLSTPDEWKRALGKRTVFISWCALGENLLVTCVSHDEEGVDIQMEMKPLKLTGESAGEESVEKLVQEFKDLAELSRRARRSSWENWGQRIVEAFFPPNVVDKIVNAERVLLSPDVRDWSLGLHLAWIDGDFLCLNKQTFLVHSLSTYARLRTMEQKKARLEDSLVAGIDTFHGKTLPDWLAYQLLRLKGMDPEKPLFLQCSSSLEKDERESVIKILSKEIVENRANYPDLTLKRLNLFLRWLLGETIHEGDEPKETLAEVGREARTRIGTTFWAPDLKRSVAEAVAVSKIYHSKLLTEEEASKQEVLNALDLAPVIHLSTHGGIDSRLPGLSALILHPVGSDDGLITTQDLSHRSLRARTVSLSACVSALGKQGGPEGLCGVSYGFLNAGAKSVVSALKSVGDSSSELFMTKMHQIYSAGGIPISDAVQRTSKELDSQGYLPITWALYIVLGDGTSALEKG